MTSFGTRTVRCSLCGTSSSHAELESSHEFGSRDLDGRPAEGLRDTMSAWIQVCPGCLRCVGDLEAPEPTAWTVVGSEAYRRQLDDPAQSSLANQFACRAMLDEASDAPFQAAVNLLRAAWVCDDGGNEEGARRCRGRAADLLGRLTVRRISPPAELAVQRVELLRRAGRLDHARLALAEARALEIGDEILRQVLAYQENLVARGDMSSRTVADAVEWAEAVRVAAFLEEARHEGLTDLEAILRAVRHEERGLRKWAVSRHAVLAEAGRAGRLSAAQVDVLADAVRQPDTAWRAAEVLADAGLATERLLEAVEADVKASPGPRFFVEEVAEILLPRAISMATGSGAVDAARRAAGSAHPKARDLASRILQAAEGSPEFKALCAELQSPEPRLRAAAVVKLHRTEKPEALELVKRALREDPAPEVRRDAAMRLGLRWDEGVPRCLLEALMSEPDEATRPLIAKSLRIQLEMWEARNDPDVPDLRARIKSLVAKEPAGWVAQLLKSCLSAQRDYYR
jgi:hypothetical protein